MHIDSPATLINHSVELTGCTVELCHQVGLVEIVDGVVDHLDVAGCIVATHTWPVDLSVGMVDLGLNVEDPGHASASHSFDVVFRHRVWANKDVLLTNTLEREVAHEVGVTFLDVSVHKEDVIRIFPL